jgi:hypothetical protein
MDVVYVYKCIYEYVYTYIYIYAYSYTYLYVYHIRLYLHIIHILIFIFIYLYMSTEPAYQHGPPPSLKQPPQEYFEENKIEDGGEDYPVRYVHVFIHKYINICIGSLYICAYRRLFGFRLYRYTVQI